MIFMFFLIASSDVIVNDGVCGHWATAAIVAGLIKWSDIIPYIQHNTS
jgi:hypothetical protein